MSLLSTAVTTTVGLLSKAFMYSGSPSVAVTGLPVLINELNSSERQKGQGVITVSNHLSVLDDPLIWSILPFHPYWNTKMMKRWTLGASDIMFTNPVFSVIFRSGQVLEAVRGAGIFQPAVDVAIEKLNSGAWVHLFSEGKVCQPSTYIETDGVANLRRFKWGIGRILMEAKEQPSVIPMWLTGFDKLMPEGRTIPYKFIPHLGVQLGVHFGEPVPAKHLRMALSKSDGSPDSVRSEVTAVIQREVEGLGRKISGKLLNKN